MSCLGTGHMFILLWHHSSQCPTIPPSFCHPRSHKALKEGGQTGLPVGPGQAVGAELRVPSSWRRALVDLPGVGVKVIAMAAIFRRERSHSGATSPCAGSSAVESALLRTEPSPLHGQQGSPSHPPLRLLEPCRDPLTVESSAPPHCALHFISLTSPRAQDSGSFPEDPAQAAALPGPGCREWALLAQICLVSPGSLEKQLLELKT